MPTATAAAHCQSFISVSLVFAVAAAAAAASPLLSADLAGERSGRQEFAALDLQRQHGKASRCWTTDDGGGVLGVELTAVTGAVENLLVRLPHRHRARLVGACR